MMTVMSILESVKLVELEARMVYRIVGLGSRGVPEISPLLVLIDKPLGKVDPGAIAKVTPAPETVGLKGVIGVYC